MCVCRSPIRARLGARALLTQIDLLLLCVEANRELGMGIRVGLVALLQDKIEFCPESSLHVICAILQPELLTLLADTQCDATRTLAVSLIHVVLVRGGAAMQERFGKAKGFLLLSNVLSQYAVTPDLFRACCEVYAGSHWRTSSTPWTSATPSDASPGTGESGSILPGFQDAACTIVALVRLGSEAPSLWLFEAFERLFLR